MSAGLKMSNDVVYFHTDIDGKSFGPLFDNAEDAHAWSQQNLPKHAHRQIVRRVIDDNHAVPGYDPDTSSRK